jgi:hypothetical protein
VWWREGGRGGREGEERFERGANGGKRMTISDRKKERNRQK